MAAIQFTGGANASFIAGHDIPSAFVDLDTGLPAEGYGHLLDPVGEQRVMSQVEAPIPPPKALPTPAVKPAPVAEGDFNLISLARKRKRSLEKEIKRLRALEKEHLQLCRLLKAAETPLALVHDIKPNTAPRGNPSHRNK